MTLSPFDRPRCLRGRALEQHPELESPDPFRIRQQKADHAVPEIPGWKQQFLRAEEIGIVYPSVGQYDFER